MLTYFWIVSLHGKHLFRTDKVPDYGDTVQRIRDHLTHRFPSTLGYIVEEYSQDDTWFVRTLE